MKITSTLFATAIIGLISAAFVGCGTAPSLTQPSNLNPVGIVGPLNPPVFNGGAVTLAMTQLRQFGTLDVVGPGINFHLAKNMPPGYVDQPVTPLTADESTLCEHAFIADTLYGMRNDHSSWDMTLVPAMGWTVTLHTAFPPSTLNTNPVTITVTSTNVTPATSVSVPVPAQTNIITSEVKAQ